MDLWLRSLRRASSRFPRPRGDGPDACGILPVVAGVSPPTRGWTRSAPRYRRRQPGFPAHAGMDLSRPRQARCMKRFPRPRGDGPEWPCSSRQTSRVSPPTRGWTSQHADIGRTGGGFPAHAGMDRTKAPMTLTRARFPRPRGDGPRTGRRDRVGDQVSPPTRGWTSDRGRLGYYHNGFPAHAGMDPVSNPTYSTAVGFPRPRGDGPSRSSASR